MADNIHRPLHYHGEHIASNFFEGWYFKFVKLNETANDPSVSMAVIPGIYRPNPDSLDKQGAHAFVVVVGMPGTTRAAYYRFPRKTLSILEDNAPSKMAISGSRLGTASLRMTKCFWTCLLQTLNMSQ
ncbi:unnamed protein product [Mortierella alpina]